MTAFVTPFAYYFLRRRIIYPSVFHTFCIFIAEYSLTIYICSLFLLTENGGFIEQTVFPIEADGIVSWCVWCMPLLHTVQHKNVSTEIRGRRSARTVYARASDSQNILFYNTYHSGSNFPVEICGKIRYLFLHASHAAKPYKVPKLPAIDSLQNCAEQI